MDKRQLRKEKRAEFVRGQFVEAALEILSGQGVAAVTMEAVARRAGYATGSIYNYFSGKDDLLFGAMKKNVESLCQAIPTETPEGVHAEGYLVGVVTEFLRRIEERRPLFLALQNDMSLLSPEAHKELHDWVNCRVAEMVEALGGFLGKLLNLPETDEEDGKDAAWALVSLLQGEVIRMMLVKPSATALLRRAPRLVKFFLYGVWKMAESDHTAGGRS